VCIWVYMPKVTVAIFLCCRETSHAHKKREGDFFGIYVRAVLLGKRLMMHLYQEIQGIPGNVSLLSRAE